MPAPCQFGAFPLRLYVEIPIIQQLSLNVVPCEPLPVIGLDLELTPTIQIPEVCTNRLQALAATRQDFDYDFRCPAHRPRDQRDFLWADSVPTLRPAPRVTRNI